MAGKHPALPSNYVSLAVLKERWLEQQRKQSQEEELQRKHEEDQKKKIQIQNGGKSLQKSQSSILQASMRNYQITRMRDGQTSLARKPTLKESNSETSVSVSKVEQVEDKVNEKAKKKTETCRKSRAAEKLSVPTSRFQPVEKLQVHASERNEKIEEAGCEFPNNSVDQAAKHNFWKPRVRMSTSGKTKHQYSREFSMGGFSSRSPTVEQLQAYTTEKNYKIEEAGYKFPHNSVDQAANHNVSKPRVRMGIAGKTNRQYSREFSKDEFSSLSPPIEQLQADTTEKYYRIEEAGCKFPHNSVDQTANRDVCKPTVKLSIAGKTNHQYSNHFQKGGFHHKQKDSKQVWVKKGETTATHSSDTGISVNAGGASSSYSGQDTNGTTSIW